MRQWTAVLVCAAVLTLGSASWTRAADNGQQVEQLQKQLAAMQEEMAGMRKALEDKNVPADTRSMMNGHMMRMDQQWQGMHQQCCMMNSAGCGNMMGSPPKTP